MEHKSKTIILVEDDVDIRQVYKSFLVQKGYTVFVASDGQEALDILDTLSVDLMITDIVMPNIDGYELIQGIEAKAASEQMPIVVVSGVIDEFDMSKYKSVVKFLHKPTLKEDMLAEIDKIFGT